MQQSIWSRGEELPTFPVLEGEHKTDVLIIGGGMAGLLCAYRLREAGVACLVIEADRILSGTTANTTAKLTVHHGLIYEKLLRKFGAHRARQYYLANQQALVDLSDLAEGMDCGFRRCRNYLYVKDSPAQLEGEMDAMSKLKIPFSFREKLELPFPTAGGICMEDQAQFEPLVFAANIARGLPVFEKSQALSYRNGVVATERGSIHAERILVATHFPIWNRHGGYFLKMYQERAYVLALSAVEPLDGMYLDAAAGGLSLRSYGDTLLLGGGSHRTGKPGRGWEPLMEARNKYYPGTEIVARWAAQDCMTLDGVPYIGRYGRHTPNVYVATGFRKWGMSTSMVAANLLTDQLLGRENPAFACFSPQRSGFHLQLAANAGEAIGNLLRPTKPRCPHLGCALHWNPQERSWDCPCHGSRFSDRGELLDGPATGNHPNISS